MTRAISPDEFDWETVDVMPTPSCQSTINLPWDGAGSLATTYGSDKLNGSKLAKYGVRQLIGYKTK